MNALWLAGATLGLPFAAFVVLALVWPFRHTGRPAAWLSTLAAVGAFACALLAWREAPGEGAPPLLYELDWLVHAGRTIATVPVTCDNEAPPEDL